MKFIFRIHFFSRIKIFILLLACAGGVRAERAQDGLPLGAQHGLRERLPVHGPTEFQRIGPVHAVETRVVQGGGRGGKSGRSARLLLHEHRGQGAARTHAEFTHRPAPGGQGEWCTFETLIAEHHLDDPALARLARIVHAADIAADLDADPLGPGLLAIGIGGLDVEADDQALLARGTFVYDALYAWCARQLTAPAGQDT